MAAGSRPAGRLRTGTIAYRTQLTGPLFVILWSSAFIAGSVGLRSAPPLLLTLLRFAAAGVILALVAWLTRAPWPRGRQLGHVIVAGLLLQAVQFGGFYWAMALGLPAALTALVQGMTPVLTALLAWLLLAERTRAVQRLGFGLGAAGVVLAVAGRLDLHASVAAALIPAAVGLAGASLGMLYQQRFCGQMDLRTGTATQLLVSLPVLAVMTLLIEHPQVTDPLPFAGAMAWLVLVNSIGTFMLLYAMLRHRPASQVSSLFFVTPAVTAIMAYVFLGESLSWLTIAGLIVSGVGVTLATRSVDGGAHQAADPVGQARRDPGQDELAHGAGQERAVGDPGHEPAADERDHGGQHQRGRERAEARQVGDQRDQGAERERDQRRAGGDVRGGQVLVVDPELLPDVDPQRGVRVGGDLPGDLVGEVGVHAAAPEHGR
jgi:drug/metabolite transporter (DMT)-like permease